VRVKSTDRSVNTNLSNSYGLINLLCTLITQIPVKNFSGSSILVIIGILNFELEHELLVCNKKLFVVELLKLDVQIVLVEKLAHYRFFYACSAYGLPRDTLREIPAADSPAGPSDTTRRSYRRARRALATSSH